MKKKTRAKASCQTTPSRPSECSTTKNRLYVSGLLLQTLRFTNKFEMNFLHGETRASFPCGTLFFVYSLLSAGTFTIHSTTQLANPLEKPSYSAVLLNSPCFLHFHQTKAAGFHQPIPTAPSKPSAGGCCWARR